MENDWIGKIEGRIPALASFLLAKSLLKHLALIVCTKMKAGDISTVCLYPFSCARCSLSSMNKICRKAVEVFKCQFMESKQSDSPQVLISVALLLVSLKRAVKLLVRGLFLSLSQSRGKKFLH